MNYLRIFIYSLPSYEDKLLVLNLSHYVTQCKINITKKS
jgi:hypothetical protein